MTLVHVLCHFKFIFKLILLVEVFAFWSDLCLGENYVIVSTHSGDVRGVELKDKDGGTFYSFQSIPFAKPPVGKLRFKAPEPEEPRDDILNATKPAPVCPQFEFDRIIGQEDCLYLNVYTPQLASDRENLPVMVYIHGGAYFEGSGSYEIYGPQFFMPENVVLVTINYRLGRFGSISFEDQSLGVPGNAHLKDQVMALKWVQRNIQGFGGDKDRVTIFGESVGGASVHLHMLSPMSKGLFHRVISQSGVSLNVWNQGFVGTGKLIAQKLGFGSKTEAEMIEELQQLPMSKIMETQSKDGLGVPVHTKFEYSPVIEKQTNEPAFLPDLPINIIESGNYTKVPYMLGYNNNDTIIFQVINRIYNGAPFYITDFNQLIPHDINFRTEDEKQQLIKDIKKKYYGDSEDYSSVEIFLRLALGPWITSAYDRVVMKHLKTSNTPLYFYVFSGDTKLNFFKRLHPLTAKYTGASHMDELGHLFKTKYTPCIEAGSKEAKALNNMIKLWTNFAKYGNPTPKDNTLGTTWLPVTKDTFNYLDIGVELKNRVNPDEDTFKFWHNVYEKYNKD